MMKTEAMNTFSKSIGRHGFLHPVKVLFLVCFFHTWRGRRGRTLSSQRGPKLRLGEYGLVIRGMGWVLWGWMLYELWIPLKAFKAGCYVNFESHSSWAKMEGCGGILRQAGSSWQKQDVGYWILWMLGKRTATWFIQIPKCFIHLSGGEVCCILCGFILQCHFISDIYHMQNVKN